MTPPTPPPNVLNTKAVYDLDTSTVLQLGVLHELDHPAPVWQP